MSKDHLPDTLELKANILVEGIRATEDALAGVGTIYKEQNHGLFGWDFEDHGTELLPDDFLLQDGTVVQFRKNSHSPFLIVKTNDGSLHLTERGQDLCQVQWISRPKFYNQKTTDGTPMVKIAQIGGEDCFFVCYNNYCAQFAHHTECHFCNLVDTTVKYRSIIPRKKTSQIADAAAAAFSEGVCRHILMTGGCFQGEEEVEIVTSILAAIRQSTGKNRIPGTILPSPPKNVRDLQRYHDAGIDAIAFSLELWDEAYFKAICPGKSSQHSHASFVEVIKEAVKIFGPGNVYGVFVMGLEPAESLGRGIDTLSSLGAHVVPFVWSPNPGSQLAGHRAPFGGWFAKNIRQFAEVVKSKNLPPSTNHCRKCDGNNMLHDGLNQIGVEP